MTTHQKKKGLPDNLQSQKEYGILLYVAHHVLFDPRVCVWCSASYLQTMAWSISSLSHNLYTEKSEVEAMKEYINIG